MESISIFFVYVLFPLIGLIILIRGVINYRRNKKKIIVGFIFLIIPLLHSIVIGISQNYYENKVAGVYAIKGDREILLTVNSDKTFFINKTSGISNYGKGTWALEMDDCLLLILKLNDSKGQNLFCEVDISENVELKLNPFNENKIYLEKRMLPAQSKD